MRQDATEHLRLKGLAQGPYSGSLVMQGFQLTAFNKANGSLIPVFSGAECEITIVTELILFKLPCLGANVTTLIPMKLGCGVKHKGKQNTMMCK